MSMDKVDAVKLIIGVGLAAMQVPSPSGASSSPVTQVVISSDRLVGGDTWYDDGCRHSHEDDVRISITRRAESTQVVVGSKKCPAGVDAVFTVSPDKPPLFGTSVQCKWRRDLIAAGEPDEGILMDLAGCVLIERGATLRGEALWIKFTLTGRNDQKHYIVSGQVVIDWDKLIRITEK
jgi:hypothetical protein